MCRLLVLAFVFSAPTFNKVERASGPVLVLLFPLFLQASWPTSRWYSHESPRVLSGLCPGAPTLKDPTRLSGEGRNLDG